MPTDPLPSLADLLARFSESRQDNQRQMDFMQDIVHEREKVLLNLLALLKGSKRFNARAENALEDAKADLRQEPPA